MDLATLTNFFMWCTFINGGILILWTIFIVLTPEWIYKKHNRWFNMPRETWNITMFRFLALFKILFIVFNAVPYAALLIVS